MQEGTNFGAPLESFGAPSHYCNLKAGVWSFSGVDYSEDFTPSPRCTDCLHFRRLLVRSFTDLACRYLRRILLASEQESSSLVTHQQRNLRICHHDTSTPIIAGSSPPCIAIVSNPSVLPWLFNRKGRQSQPMDRRRNMGICIRRRWLDHEPRCHL